MQSAELKFIFPEAKDVANVRDLYERGLYLQALSVAEKCGPFEDWRGVEALVLAGRLTANLGAQRRAGFFMRRAYRSDRTNPEAAYYRGWQILSARGPWKTWQFLRRMPEWTGEPDRAAGDLLALRARVLAMFRDFDRAHEDMEAALAKAPGRPWLWCEKAEILRVEDRHEDAWACIQHALSLDRFFRPSVRVAAEILQLLGRDEEAVGLLVEADRALECGQITSHLAVLQAELGRHEAALVSWERTRNLHPLAEPEITAWMEARLADELYALGRFGESAVHARKVDDDFYYAFSQQLEAEGRHGGKVLPVEFVAQHHMTCAPATLSALCRYWKMPVDHAALAAEICYEGTSDHIERDWAERAGFVVRECRLNWDTAQLLIDAGVPCTVTTSETTSAHLQALIGYDEIRRTLIFRDPGHRVSSEQKADPFFERYEAFGPRAMILLPPQEAERIAGIPFPDAEFYDAYYRLQRALERHDRGAAADELAAMETLDGNHRLTLWGKRRLASYDANPVLEAEVLAAMVERFPKNGNLLLSKAMALGRCDSRANYCEVLRELATGPAAEPVFWRNWGRELSQDKRRLGEAKRFLNMALRSQPCEGDNLAELANLLWDEHEFATATTLYRFAACLPGGGERFGKSYFLASRHVRETDAALGFLQRRFDDHGRQSVQPARALISALTALNREEQALAVLEQALAWRSSDGELLLFAADHFARSNQHRRAEETLRSAESAASRSAWLRTAAALNGYRCDHAAALDLWRQVLDLEPLAVDAQRAVARFLAETAGRAATRSFLETHTAAFPHHLPLHELCVDWFRGEDPGEAERVIRRGLELNTTHAWMRRELALNLARQGRMEEAVAEAEEARQIEPLEASSHSTLGRIRQLAGSPTQARQAYREAIRLQVDLSPAITGLFAVAETYEQKREAVDFVRGQLASQVTFGDGLSTFREEAFPVLAPEEMLAVLREADAARKDLWQAGAALASQLVDMQRFGEALEVANELTRSFPSVPRVWHDLAMVHKAAGNREGEIDALGRALAINPTWSQASRALAEVYERKGDFEKSRDLLQQAVRHEPLECANHGCLADLEWRAGERQSALDRLEHAIRLNPQYQWAWNALAEWSVQSGAHNRSLSLAQALAGSRAGEVRSWLRLSEQLPEDAVAEKLEALEKAERLDPRNPEVHDVRASVLGMAGRMEEAIVACAPAVFGGEIPILLKGREAWIEARRGHAGTAVDKMKSAVALAPDYYWGWSCLAQWLTEQERLPEALEAARALVRLAPRASVPLGYLADIQRRMKRQKEATETFRKAFHLDPGYRFAGMQLFEAQLAAGSFRAAEETLALLQKHHPGPETHATWIRMACRRKMKRESLRELRVLCFVPAAGTEWLNSAACAIAAAGWAREAGKIYAEIVNDPAVNAEVGRLWVLASARGTNPPSYSGLKQIPAETQAGLAARSAFLDLAAKAKDKAVIESLVRDDGPAMARDLECWGQVGYAYSSLGLHKELAAWQSGWRERKDALPWMLQNLAFSLRELGKDDDAHEVSLRAVEGKEDHTSVHHQLFLAWDEAVAGDIADAQSRLKKISRDDPGAFFTVLRALTVAVIKVLSEDQPVAKLEYASQKVILRQAAWESYFQDPLMRRYGKKAVSRMAAHAGEKPFRLGRLFSASFLNSPEGVRIGWFVGFLIFLWITTGLRGCQGW